MEAWLLSGQLLDLILLLVALEATALVVMGRYFKAIPPPLDLLPNLASGAALMLALRFALTDTGWQPIALCLSAALGAHLVDLIRRLQRD